VDRPFRRILIATIAVTLSLGLLPLYNQMLDLQLAAYRGRKSHQIEQISRRDARRRVVPGLPAVRERILKEEFGDLPEMASVRTELELTNTWQWLVLFLFTPLSVGTALYLTLAEKPTFRRRLLRGLPFLLGASQAFPLMLFPDDALRFFRMIGLPLIIAASAILLAEVVRDRILAFRQKAVN